MKLAENSSLGRYEWATQKLGSLLSVLQGKPLIYDIGSRDGILKSYIRDQDIRYEGFDLFPLQQDIRQWNIENPFPYPDGPADVILFLEVIEHLNNPWLSIGNLGKTLKEGGYLVLTTPNPGWSKSRVDLLQSGYLSCFTQNDLDVNHHVFIPWPHIVEKLLKDTGFEVVEYVTLDGKTNLFSAPLLNWKLPFILINRLIKIAIEKRNPSSCGMSYGIVARKVKSL